VARIVALLLCLQLSCAVAAPGGSLPAAPAPAAPGDSQTGSAQQEAAIAAAGMSIQTMDSLNDTRPLAIGDRLSFSVLEDEKPPVEIFVTDSGEADIPYIGRLMVVNKTCKKLAYAIKATLEVKFYYQATVLIGLDSAGVRPVSKGKVYVMGEVANQGPQDIPTDETYTVSKAILKAGGFGPYANKRKVKLVRSANSHGGAETIMVDLIEVMEKGQTAKDPEVTPDDLIIVPENAINF
jgi:protein involved in polysaccharide export with SLBB domain